jgi:outer membrane murein-binding lipoprotein Lpp
VSLFKSSEIVELEAKIASLDSRVNTLTEMCRCLESLNKIANEQIEFIEKRVDMVERNRKKV